MKSLTGLFSTVFPNRLRVRISMTLGVVLILLSQFLLSAVPSVLSSGQIRSGVMTSDSHPDVQSSSAKVLPRIADSVNLSQSASSTTEIDFDHDAFGNSLSAPCLFVETSPLTELYAPLGVHFMGLNSESGGAVLNQCGFFGVPAASGFNFLAFNRDVQLPSGGVPTDPETIVFDSVATSVSLVASAGFESGTFRLQAFDSNNIVVATDVGTAPVATYITLVVSSAGGIKKVVLTMTDNGPQFGEAFVLDNLVIETLAFDICLQDDSSSNVLRFNSSTGDYQFTGCSSFVIGGTASISQKGNIITLLQNGPDRRLLARMDKSQNKGTASLQLFASSITVTITDRNTANNTCACP
jgi:hypothetical protein